MSGEDDRDIWRSVTSDVKPLTGGRKPVRVETDLKPVSPKVTPAPAVVTPLRKAQEPLKLGQAPGVDKRTAERLRRGQLPIEGRLDLHGHTRESAHRALCGFLAAAWESGRRVVLVVTGKGQGILKDAVPRWLNENPIRGRVLLVAQAQPRDGGGGALYVLLRRRR